MHQNKTSNLINILTDLIEGKSVTSLDYHVSNANQYFKTIKDNGIELLEKWINNSHNRGKTKLRTLIDDNTNMQRAKKYLLSLKHKVQ